MHVSESVHGSRHAAHIAGRFPVSVPPTGCLFEDLDRRLVVALRVRELYLRLLQLGLVLALFLAHDHVSLREEALDLEAVVLVAIAGLVDRGRLLHLHLEQLLDAVLHNLAPLLHSARESLERLFQLRLHLLCDALVCLAHGLYFSADDVKGHAQRARLGGAQGFPREVEQFARVFVFDGGARGVEGLELVRGDFGIVHALEHRRDAGVIFAPEVVGNCAALAVGRCTRRGALARERDRRRLCRQWPTHGADVYARERAVMAGTTAM